MTPPRGTLDRELRKSHQWPLMRLSATFSHLTGKSHSRSNLFPAVAFLKAVTRRKKKKGNQIYKKKIPVTVMLHSLHPWGSEQEKSLAKTGLFILIPRRSSYLRGKEWWLNTNAWVWTPRKRSWWDPTVFQNLWASPSSLTHTEPDGEARGDLFLAGLSTTQPSSNNPHVRLNAPLSRSPLSPRGAV